MAVVQFNAQALQLRVEYWFEGPGQAHYTCWLVPRATLPGEGGEPFIDKEATQVPDPVTLANSAKANDGATLKVKVSCAGEVNDEQTLHFNIYDDTTSSRIGGFEEGLAVKIKGNELDDRCDRAYLLRRRA